jgi:hypothetical protein
MVYPFYGLHSNICSFSVQESLLCHVVPQIHSEMIWSLIWLYKQGVHPTIKGEVWEFLLGCYDPKSTTEQRNQLRQQRRFSRYCTFCMFVLFHISNFSFDCSMSFCITKCCSAAWHCFVHHGIQHCFM